MDRQAYLRRFSRAVRWRLPKSEADDVLSDYDEIFCHRSDGDDAVTSQTLGEPVQAARLLSEPRTYHRWLAAFGLMSICLLLLEFLLLRASFPRFPGPLLYMVFILGSAISLVWFRPGHGERRSTPLPKGLLPMLLGLSGVILLAAIIMTGLITQVWLFIPPALYGHTARWTLLSGGTAAAAFGLFGLVKARLSDRRWRALYVMGLSTLVTCVLMQALLVTTAFSASSSAWLIPHVYGLGAVGLTGLVCAGVSLC